MIFVCGAFTHGTKKPCKHCKNFMLWGVSTGLCGKYITDKQTWDHCKYFKREARIWTKDGRCKVNKNELYC